VRVLSGHLGQQAYSAEREDRGCIHLLTGPGTHLLVHGVPEDVLLEERRPQSELLPRLTEQATLRPFTLHTFLWGVAETQGIAAVKGKVKHYAVKAYGGVDV
jgi:hypothetical protein